MFDEYVSVESVQVVQDSAVSRFLWPRYFSRAFHKEKNFFTGWTITIFSEGLHCKIIFYLRLSLGVYKISEIVSYNKIN
jgi:hypothetical protein